MKQNQIILLVAIITISMVSISINRSSGQDFVSFEDNDNKFSVQYPSNWIRMDAPPFVAFFAPPVKYFAEFTILAKDLPLQNSTLSDVIKEEMSLLGPNSIIESNSTTLSGLPAHILIASRSSPGFTLDKQVRVFTVKDNKEYIIEFVAQPENFEQHYQTVAKMIKSFKFQ